MKRNVVDMNSIFDGASRDTPSKPIVLDNLGIISKPPRSYLHITIFILWIIVLVWVIPQLLNPIGVGYNIPSTIVGIFLNFLIVIIWLYGTCHIGYLLFVVIYKYFCKKPERELAQLTSLDQPPVAIIFKNCNDFLEASILSCLKQEYSNFKIYILNESKDESIIKKIDRFAEKYSKKICVIHRGIENGVLTENMNSFLEHYVTEPYFAITNAGEILPNHFLSKLINVIGSDDACGFVQANYHLNTKKKNVLRRSLYRALNVHRTYYLALRNDFGFVMFRGHGAILSTRCWQETGGFPNMVNENFGFAINAREKRFRGRFVKDVICVENFPKYFKLCRARKGNWIRLVYEFFGTKLLWLAKAKNITWQEKLDLIFQTLNV